MPRTSLFTVSIPSLALPIALAPALASLFVGCTSNGPSGQVDTSDGQMLDDNTDGMVGQPLVEYTGEMTGDLILKSPADGQVTLYRAGRAAPISFADVEAGDDVGFVNLAAENEPPAMSAVAGDYEIPLGDLKAGDPGYTWRFAEVRE